ncbi:voltage-dependent chloride channel 1, chloroplastic-like [Aristolochia californica]|uniref:voltage-dependent chloride channel 1, chloroplastic-like n=1 Tax=Aristolochia californica TaxID=171875 RepID=UPI0035D9FAB0
MRSLASPLNTPPNLSSHSCLAPQLPKLLLPSFRIPSKPAVCRVFCSQSLGSPPDSGSERNFDPISLFRSITDWSDEIKERGMRQRRLLYNHGSWQAHRSSLRHVRHLLSSLTSRVILSLVPPVLVFTAFAAALAAYNTAAAAQLLPGPFPVLRASSLPYQLTAPALALLLVFRTEASYSRFEEGRKVWARVMVGTADFAREVMGGVEAEVDLDLRKALLNYIMAFPVALKCHVIYGSDIKQDLRNLLEEDDIGVILGSKHRPRCIIEFISQSLQLLHLDEAKRHILESKISCFHEGIGACEQLMGIPIPLSYTRLTSRFLVLWHLTLPIILWDDCNWIVVPATFISAASLFCIEEVGVLIEEPFPMLALDELCNLVHDSIQEAIAMESVVKVQLLSKKKSHSKKCSTNGRPSSS